MATESLIVELDADTRRLDGALRRTNGRLSDLDSQTRQNDRSFHRLTATAGSVASALTVAGVAGFALASALTAVILKSASSQRELSILSRQAKLSTTDFEALAFATKQYGINAEQIGDISKDIADKLGEFGRDASGPFQDFASSVGLSKDEAKALAVEMQDMSSDKVIGRMVSMLEKAGASGNEVTQVMESMGNDLSRLVPLFTDGSKELDKLTGTYKKATAQIKLTAGEVKDLQGAATSFDLLTDSLGKAGSLISAQIAPMLSEFFNGIIDVVPDATQAIVNFINTFRDAESIKSIKSLNKQITISEDSIKELKKAQDELGKTWATSLDSEQSLRVQKAQYNIEIEKEIKRIGELKESRKGLADQEKLDAAERLAGGKIGSGGFSGGGGGGGTGDEVQAISDRFKTESDLLRQKLDSELEIVGENNALRLELEQEYQNNLSAIQLKAQDEAMAQGEDLTNQFKKYKDYKISGNMDLASSALELASALSSGSEKANNVVFLGAQALAATQVFFNTQAASVRALAELGPIAGAPVAASIETSGYLKMAAIAATSLGSVIGGGGGGGGVASTTAASSGGGNEAESSSLSVDASDTSGSRQDFVIRFEGSGDDITEAIAKNMKVMQLSGSLS